jgi:hypothetical protein
MTSQPYSQLVRYKRWADRGLYDVVAQNLEQLDAQDAAILFRILDRIHVVDKIFQHHLLGARSDRRSRVDLDLCAKARSARFHLREEASSGVAFLVGARVSGDRLGDRHQTRGAEMSTTPGVQMQPAPRIHPQ